MFPTRARNLKSAPLCRPRGARWLSPGTCAKAARVCSSAARSRGSSRGVRPVAGRRGRGEAGGRAGLRPGAAGELGSSSGGSMPFAPFPQHMPINWDPLRDAKVTVCPTPYLRRDGMDVRGRALHWDSPSGTAGQHQARTTASALCPLCPSNGLSLAFPQRRVHFQVGRAAPGCHLLTAPHPGMPVFLLFRGKCYFPAGSRATLWSATQKLVFLR